VKPQASLPRLRFGLFEANFQTGELRKQGLKIRLGRHAMKLLALLLEHPGQIRTREEIRQQLWGSGIFVNFDQSLNKTVHQLRQALGDTAADPHYIETVPERGYKFIYFLRPAAQQITKQQMRPGRIAVLPFATEPANREMELLNKILIEALIDKLSLTPGLRVLAYSTVHSYKQQFDPRAIGQSLLVPSVVIGDMTQATDQLLLHVELIDVRDGTQCWGSQFKYNYAEVQRDPGVLALQVFGELRPVLSQTVARRAPEKNSGGPAVLQLPDRKPGGAKAPQIDDAELEKAS
jgi:DNA-binding winged helix-turn-helix (wHTH) protein